MRKLMLKGHHLRACLFIACLFLCMMIFGGVASAAQYTMVVSNNAKIDGTYGPVRFGAYSEVNGANRVYDGMVLVVPNAFTLKKDGTVVATELYSLELVDALTVVDTHANEEGSAVYAGNQVVWTKEGSYYASEWGGIQSGGQYYCSHKSNYTAYKGVYLTESTEARCNFTFKLADNSLITLQGKLQMEGNCWADDCHMLIGVASMDVKVAHTVTLSQDSPTTAGTTSVKVAEGEDMPDVTIPQKTNCTFNGYFSEEGGKGTQYYGAYKLLPRKWTRVLVRQLVTSPIYGQ